MIRKIVNPVYEELKEAERFLCQLAGSDLPVVRDIADHISAYRGKGLRPVLLLLCSGLSGGVSRESIEAAAAVELLHTTTLIHDDVVDRSDLRRGGPTVNSLWGNRTAVLAGDIFFSRVMSWLVELDISEVSSVFSSAIRKVCEGELIQSQNSRGNRLISEKEYFDIISLKTASLISASCELGVLTSRGGGNGERPAAGRYGNNLGIAFQIKDDLMDYNGRKEKMGKPASRDLAGSILTLPLLYGLKNSRNGDRAAVLEIINRGIEDQEIDFIKDFAEKSGGLEYAGEKAGEYARAARSSLNDLPGSRYRDAMSRLAEFVIERDF